MKTPATRQSGENSTDNAYHLPGPAACSILFGDHPGEPPLVPEAPACFGDLNLDQIVKAATAGRDEYELSPFYYTMLTDVETIEFRHEVFRDLEAREFLDRVKSFGLQMSTMRRELSLSRKLEYRYERARWLLEAIHTYSNAVTALARDLKGAKLDSRGFRSLRDHVINYTDSSAFVSMQREDAEIREELANIHYSLMVTDGPTVKVRRSQSERDYVSEVEATFAKFRQASQEDYLVDIRPTLNMNHVDAAIAEFVARLYPEPFARLLDFCTRSSHFTDSIVTTFDREVQFYVSYLEYVAPLRLYGLSFCYPRLSVDDRCTSCTGAYDLALAHVMAKKEREIVCNDFHLADAEQLFVVTGPNQGGKTTFARTFGQLHFLAALGCPVPGTRAELLLVDGVYTHFGKEEELAELRGRLEDDLVRIQEILRMATSRSVIIMNEIFSSTTVKDAILLGMRIIDRIIEAGALGVLVTFLDELARSSRGTVSMVAGVDPEDPLLRTFKITRAEADGLAYALTLAASHGLTHDAIVERVCP